MNTTPTKPLRFDTPGRDALRAYRLREEGSGVEVSISATDDADARKQAAAWARTGDWDTEGGTIWVDVRVTDDEGDYEIVTVAIDPDEPECSEDEGEHEWDNYGVQGHGGGVIVVEACSYCGTRRITDTWATRPDTGEQGFASLRYETETD